MAPDGGERFGNVEVLEADTIISWNLDLQIVAWSEIHPCVDVQWFENELLNERGDVPVADDPKLQGRLLPGPRPAGIKDIEPESPSPFLNRVGG